MAVAGGVVAAWMVFVPAAGATSTPLAAAPRAAPGAVVPRPHEAGATTRAVPVARSEPRATAARADEPRSTPGAAAAAPEPDEPRWPWMLLGLLCIGLMANGRLR
ncbi:MAG TPA: hypothetical protein VFZ93_11205 [Albitalea sp.]